jgi:hypothetical protein
MRRAGHDEDGEENTAGKPHGASSLKLSCPSQLLYEVDIDGYVHVVPVVRRGRILFLKTIYPPQGD